MNVYALLSWFDEKPEHLERCITSLQGIADHLIALDGPYATFPQATRCSSIDQHHAIVDTAAWAGMQCTIEHLAYQSEVAKRARLFELARKQGASERDWLLIVDADTHVAPNADIRPQLQATSLDVADVSMSNINAQGRMESAPPLRILFRALPGLTVERTHWLYTTPNGNPRRFLWHTPDGNISAEPALDLTASLQLMHRRIEREPDRNDKARRYYEERDQAKLESAGDWL